MKIIAINASPRKEWNTAKLLSYSLEGALSKGANTQLIHLYDVDFKGCKSCFSCKKKGSKSLGKCSCKDGLTPILETIEKSDGLILGSPCYLGTPVGAMHSFLERLIYPYVSYDQDITTYCNKKMPVGFIYTMNANEERMKNVGFDQPVRHIANILKEHFGYSEWLLVNDTYQFDDYSQYFASKHDLQAKEKRLNEVFPLECTKAYEMGARFAAGLDIT